MKIFIVLVSVLFLVGCNNDKFFDEFQIQKARVIQLSDANCELNNTVIKLQYEVCSLVMEKKQDIAKKEYEKKLKIYKTLSAKQVEAFKISPPTFIAEIYKCGWQGPIIDCNWGRR